MLSCIMFGSMKYFGILRVSKSVEMTGLDSIKHGEPAYPLGGYNDGEHPYSQKKGTFDKEINGT